MGQAESGNLQQYNEQEVLSQLAEVDPDFEYHKYVDGNCTLQEVISIRQCFLDLRSDFESQDDQDMCGNVVYQSSDPPEMVQARKLRSIPFLTIDDIRRVASQNAGVDSDSQVNQSVASESHVEEDRLVNKLQQEEGNPLQVQQ